MKALDTDLPWRASVPPMLREEDAMSETPPRGTRDGRVIVTMIVNRQPRDVTIEPRMTLLDALRESLALTGTKKGCDRGECGACTVLVDGRRILSCMTLAAMNAGRQVTTIEGLEQDGELHPV